ncbi:HAD family hydrolase [Aestuariicoccus sp. MJ-SS9]|uniref:sulfotransferase-like domain-containing protein n=1 Tax=Aestuariicoccus sp. MJ-SS9 TaxID=3079855 RepID=UPI0029067107|nr:HAD family hydrolase [Aestuariicoccus sp. MJ-SS9]MDU8910895.1 HAD family hydrolase [Aestuariicoccus sp. MJ-SS9]
MRIAMWSGPRNLSTAMMYAFGQRADVHVVDEPFYGPYLRATGLDHPMRDAIVKSRPEGTFEVEQSLIGPIPGGKPHAYHKHMCQHIVPGIPRGFMAECVNVFLIRHPARVAASFLKGYPETTAEDLGFRLQAELYDHACALGQTPVVIDSADIRENPEAMLRQLCDAVGLDWDPAMLSWPLGGHPADGVWAAHWYGAVHRSTGFAGAEGALPDTTGFEEMVAEVMPFYDRLSAVRLTA